VGPTTASEEVENYPPKILVSPDNQTAFLGDRIELRCHVEGQPKPKITWTSRRDGKLPKVGENFRIHNNGSLIFRYLRRKTMECNFD